MTYSPHNEKDTQFALTLNQLTNKHGGGESTESQKKQKFT